MAKTPVESGAKFDLSLDTEDYAQIERLSFEAYNESSCLWEAVERFQECTGHYTARVLADQLYRTWENRRCCKEHWHPVVRAKTWQVRKNRGRR